MKRLCSGRKTVAFRALFLLALLAGICSAGPIAVVPQDGIIGSDLRPWMIGWQFSVSSPITVTGLAYWDEDGDGLGEAHNVGIFDSGTGTLLVSATVPSGTVALLMGGFRVVPISYELIPGTYVIGGQQSSDADGVCLQALSVTSIAGVTYLNEERELQTSSFVMPTNNAPGSEIGIFGPNLTTVPEPASFLLVTVAGLAPGLLRKLRR
jgi:hypothetical protein